MKTMEERLLENDENSKTDLEEMVIDHEYKLTLIELGITEG